MLIRLTQKAKIAGLFLLFFLIGIFSIRQGYLFAQPALSVIENLQVAAESVVYIESENAVLSDTAKDTYAVTGLRDSERSRTRATTYTRNGAGVIIDANGIIVTTSHVVNGANRIMVRFSDQSLASAVPLWVISEYDIAFIRVADRLSSSVLGFSEQRSVQLGMTVYTIGTSAMHNQTIAQGKITGIGKRQHRTTQAVDMIQTDFSVYKGDSGGPLLDKEGHLLGLIIAAKVKQPYRTFAIPAPVIKHYYRTLRKDS